MPETRDDPSPHSTGPSGRDASELQLVERLRAGDEGAFEELVRGEGPKLLALTRRLLGNEDDAREAVQEAFLSAFRALDDFDGAARLGTWLHRIGVNAALMKLRTRERKPLPSLDDLLPRFTETGGLWESLPSSWGAPMERLQRCETRSAVRAAIDRLPDEARTALLLRDIEGLPVTAVADWLDISPNAARVRVHRARQALRTLLDPTFAEDTP